MHPVQCVFLVASLRLLGRGVCRGCHNAVKAGDDMAGSKIGHCRNDDDVTHGREERAREDVEEEGIQDDVDEDRRWVPHQRHIGGEVIGCCEYLEEQGRGMSLSLVVMASRLVGSLALGRLASRGVGGEGGDELGRLKDLVELVRVDSEGGGLLMKGEAVSSVLGGFIHQYMPSA